MKRKVYIFTGYLLGSKPKTLRVTRFQALKIVVKPVLGIIPLVSIFVSQTKRKVKIYGVTRARTIDRGRRLRFYKKAGQRLLLLQNH